MGEEFVPTVAPASQGFDQQLTEAIAGTQAFPGADHMLLEPVHHGAYLILGPSGAGKTSLMKQFIADGMRWRQGAIIISTEEPGERVLADIIRYGLDGEQAQRSGLLRIVDGYSWRLGSNPPEGFMAMNPGNLPDLSMTFETAARQLVAMRVRVTVDSATSLALHTNTDTAYRFLEVLTAKVRNLRALALFSFIPESHDQRFVSSVLSLFDGIIEMRLDESGPEITRSIRIRAMKGVAHQTKWFPFEISKTGVNLEGSKAVF